ncbi:hypothetical protein FB45DRAFT_1075440 [Roridomyces roridus]|uniref:C2H2-type domain-containing protein n=1 Tax=Roridomyces roridus TaxID=1738132 RepID=A0AAD7CI36_9AGAR|nr:hypothetical protein FB45DRAFT_1075440 [Roridomyces roridus]
MSFISNASGFTLGEGTFNNIHGDVVIYQDVPRALKRSSSNPLGEPRRKRRRKGDEDGPKIIQNKHLHLDFEIGRGQGYLLHAGNLLNGRAVIVKVFNAGKDARGQLEATVAISRGLFHPNVLRMEGISAPTSIHQFITYEDGTVLIPQNMTAEGPLAVALRDDLDMSIVLGFKMPFLFLFQVGNRLFEYTRHLASVGTRGMAIFIVDFPYLTPAQSFDVFLDINNRFLFSINPPTDANTVHDEEDDTSSVWTLFNGLCRKVITAKVLRSANRVLHDEDIERTPAIIFDSSPRSPAILKPPPSPSLDQALIQTEEAIPSDHDSVPSLVLTDGGSIHRCPGYVREEVTLTTRTADSAVVSHDAPTIQEVCSVCHEVVSLGEVFHCVCGQEEPGSRPTFKCRSCKSWSHWNCGADPDKTICHFCSSETSVIRVEDVSVLEQDAHPPAQSTPEVAPPAPAILSSTHPREMGPVLVDPKELYFDSFDSAYTSHSDPSFLDDDEELGSVERFPAPPPNTPDDPTMNVFPLSYVSDDPRPRSTYPPTNNSIFNESETDISVHGDGYSPTSGRSRTVDYFRLLTARRLGATAEGNVNEHPKEESEFKKATITQFSCPLPNCGSTFIARHNLICHIKSHNKYRLHACQCGLRFSTQEVLHVHIQRCLGSSVISPSSLSNVPHLHFQLNHANLMDCCHLPHGVALTAAYRYLAPGGPPIPLWALIDLLLFIMYSSSSCTSSSPFCTMAGSAGVSKLTNVKRGEFGLRSRKEEEHNSLDLRAKRRNQDATQGHASPP